MSQPSDNQALKGFYISNRAYYAKQDEPQEILIGLYHPSGGCTAEFAVRWIDLGKYKKVPRLEIFDDAWHMFFDMQELRSLANFNNKNVDQRTIVEFLIASGFKDLTTYEGPKPLSEYSVLLLYPESDNDGGTETYLAHVMAPDKQRAIANARAEACRTNEWPEERGADFSVLLVSEGRITDLGEAA